ncbi:MAG: hypothetical protein M1818_000486 [Claussenomyces sp. TS43310]|nr:MAG: hypothetical protein M1818_000486 [Claussenomyces sp. TS43310]
MCHDQADAFATESQAFENSSTREAYDAAIRAASTVAEPAQAFTLPNDPAHNTRVIIGPFKDCYHTASGRTSQVYRADTLALKVITETRNIEPHNPAREIRILRLLSHPSIIELLDVEEDNEKRPILVFPYMPIDLASVLSGPHQFHRNSVNAIFESIFAALAYLHERGIIHRDVKPSNILLSRAPDRESSTSGYQVKLIDYGTAWHPELSSSSEPAAHKVLEVGTTCYRAPETLFGDRSYGPSVDIWATGCLLVECLRHPSKSLFESRGTEEDGNQLGLILSIFKTIGTPTKSSWPEAVHFSTPPFEWYQSFPGHSWDDLLPNVEDNMKTLVASLVRYESGQRLPAARVSISKPQLNSTAADTIIKAVEYLRTLIAKGGCD